MYIIWKVTWVNSFRCTEDQACGHFKILIFYSKITNVINNIQDKLTRSVYNKHNYESFWSNSVSVLILFTHETKSNKTWKPRQS